LELPQVLEPPRALVRPHSKVRLELLLEVPPASVRQLRARGDRPELELPLALVLPLALARSLSRVRLELELPLVLELPQALVRLLSSARLALLPALVRPPSRDRLALLLEPPPVLARLLSKARLALLPEPRPEPQPARQRRVQRAQRARTASRPLAPPTLLSPTPRRRTKRLASRDHLFYEPTIKQRVLMVFGPF
jgi:hypothetical protein